MGATPQRQAKGRSERSRPALSPAVTGSCPAVSTPTPGRATSCGATALTRGVRWASRSLISACRACQRRARDRSAFLVADAGSLIGPGRRSAQEQTRWRIHLAQRARTGSGADDDRVDLGTALGQAASARSSPTCFWPSTWSCSTTQSSMQAQGCPLSSAACMCHWWRSWRGRCYASGRAAGTWQRSRSWSRASCWRPELSAPVAPDTIRAGDWRTGLQPTSPTWATC